MDGNILTRILFESNVDVTFLIVTIQLRNVTFNKNQ